MYINICIFVLFQCATCECQAVIEIQSQAMSFLLLQPLVLPLMERSLPELRRRGKIKFKIKTNIVNYSFAKSERGKLEVRLSQTK